MLDGEALTASGLCTFEYARAVDIPVPLHGFTYQIVNVTDDTQVLFSSVTGPRRVEVYRGVHVRTLGKPSRTRTDQVRLRVHTTEELETPVGAPMTVPKIWTWYGGDEVQINAIANGDWAYGLGAGFAGSFDYTGTFQDTAISGTGYVEWIER